MGLLENAPVRRYEVIGTIGRGGFGTVYLAEMHSEGGFSKQVALKVLNPEMSQNKEVSRRLRDEARVLGLVHHRAIVQVDGLVRLRGRWTIVMEVVRGVDVSHLIETGPLPAGVALEVIEEVAAALATAHEQEGPDGTPLRLLHRDIKPSNIAVTPAGEVKLLDFGTARANFAAREAETRSMAFGTLLYMAPERLEFVDVPAGDIYACGSVLFEMLCSEALGQTSGHPGKHRWLMRSAAERLAPLSLPQELSALVLRCLSYDPRERPTARELARACRQQRGRRPLDPWLADWAPEIIGPMVAARTLKEDEDTGAVWTEESGPHRLSDTLTGHEDDDDDDDVAPPSPKRTDVTQWVRHKQETLEEAGPQIPPALAASVHDGSVVLTREQIAEEMERMPEPEPTRPRWVVPALVLALIVGLGVSVMLLRLPTATAPTVPVATPAAPAPAPPSPPEPPSLEETNASEAPAEEKVEEVEEVEATPSTPAEPAAPAPRPRAAPRPVATGTVEVAGDADSIQLIRGNDTRTTGAVPAGTWRVRATFAGRGEVDVGEVEVVAGETVRLTCKRAFARCTVD